MYSFYENHQLNIILPYLKSGMKVLDFGCGDMGLSEKLIKKIPSINITGTDVVKPVKVPSGVKFVLYNGKRLPFDNNSFDFVFAYHVLHHSQKPLEMLAECVRVSRSGVVFVEPILRSFIDRPGLIILDFLANYGRLEQIPMPLNFLRKKEIVEFIKHHGLEIKKEENASFFPIFLPIGQTLLFYLTKA